MSIGNRLPRRTVLRASGALLGLPWLNAMSRGSSSVARPPLRVGFFYVPNGVNMDDWRLGPSSNLETLSKTLSSLAPVKDRVVVISGLAAKHNRNEGITGAHEPAGGGILVGRKCKHSEEPEVAGPSIDQVMAKHTGEVTPVDSLALGIDPGFRGDHGYSGTYMSHISWRNKTTPSALEINPKQLYERLFRGRAPQKPDFNKKNDDENSVREVTPETSVLDLVRDQTKSIQRTLGYSDRQKLDEYLEGLRSVERRVESASKDAYSHHQNDFVEDTDPHEGDPTLQDLIIPDGKGIPAVYAEHVNLMLDILTLAFQTDTTRVASFMFSCEKSTRSYPQIDAPGSHHSSSHHKKEKKNLDQLTRINSHHVELFSRMLQRMAAIEEGDGTLLDNVLFAYCSGISDGNKHNNNDLPFFLAGGGGGTVRGGRHLIYPDYTPVCNIYVEMAQRLGLPMESFGDSNSSLNNLRG